MSKNRNILTPEKWDFQEKLLKKHNFLMEGKHKNRSMLTPWKIFF